MKQTRPVNLELTTIRFPIMAIVSILHRMSGVVLFFLFPMMLYFFSASLVSESSYQEVITLLQHPLIKCLVWGFLVALSYHLFAGVRHLIMDMGFGEGLEAGRISAMALFLSAFISAILIGVWIW